MGMVTQLGKVLPPGYITLPFFRSRHGKMTWEPWQKGVKDAMGAMAKRRPWQKVALEKCHGAHGKNGHDPLKGILSGPHGAPGPGPGPWASCKGPGPAAGPGPRARPRGTVRP